MEPWTPWLSAWYTPEQEALLRRSGGLPDRVWKNNLFEVQIRPVEPFGWPAMLWLSIKRIDKEPIDENHWRIFQRIKNDLVGSENEGMEMFPAESRLADTSNQYHVFVFADPKIRFPFGFQSRLVSEISTHGAKQRPWADDERPRDLQDDAIRSAMDEVFSGQKTIQEAQDGLDGGK